MLSPQIPSFLITPITPYHLPSSPIISYPSPSPIKIKVLAFPSGKSSTLTITS